MTRKLLVPLLSLLAVAACHAGSYTEDFSRAPFSLDQTVFGVNGWTMRSVNPDFGDEAAAIRSGGPPGVDQSLEVLTRGEEAAIVRRIPELPLEVSVSKNQRICVDLLYENPQDFRSGVIYLSVATNAGGLNIGLTSGPAGEQGIAFVDLGSNDRRVNSPRGAFKAGTWYRFTVDLYQGDNERSAIITLVPLTASGDAAPVWETVVDMDTFTPTTVERFDLSVARTGRIPVIRVGRFATISVTTVPPDATPQP